MNLLRYLRDGYRWLVDPYGLLDEALRQHGLTFPINLPVLGDVLMTGDPRLIAEIVQHPDLDGGKAVTALRAILGGRSLIMLDGEAHAARHRLIAPLFRGEALRAYDELTVHRTHKVLDGLPRGRTFSMYAVLQRIALKVMVAAMFGEDSAAAGEAEGVVERFLNSFRNPLILFSPLLRVDLGPFSPWGRAVRNRRALCELIRHAARAPGGQTILARLTAGAKALGGLGEEDVVEEVLSLLLFGHDTAAATMAWAFAHVYRDRTLVERLRAEVAACEELPVDPESLPLLQACIKESMRLCPVVVHLARTATADLRLADFAVRRGQKVIPCTYLAQHNPAVFPEPYAFRPERFLGGRRYEHAYFPFGFGGRTCVGKPFAMRQMLLVLSTALRRADLELAPGYRPAPRRRLVLIVPRGGTPMRRRRAPSPAMTERFHPV
jgi:cytochrome P450